ISDESCVDQIISTYENKGDDPLFVFNVTMQNHGGYTKEAENFTPDIKVEGVDNFACLSYLSLMKLSDKAFERLCDYFAEQDEDTIIIMFGDHQPSDSVVNPLLKLSGKSCSKMTEEETLIRYQVPLVIWANFDLEKDDTDPEMSLNYLGGYVLDKAGLPLSRYQTYLAGLQKEIPVISSKKILLNDGTLYNEDAIRYDLKEELLPYRRLQYYSLFDWNSNKIQ
ncbi:MAG: sulfatase-like hydrolase/transferase, partial [Lachnospiraceae bacterium]|nr:sulfatase-like hydrolase/transferase [Lachnospiraceae bacterium]